MAAKDAESVTDDHTNSDLDNGPQAQHHTLGQSADQAAAGNHTHKASPNTTVITRGNFGSNTSCTTGIWTTIFSSVGFAPGSYVVTLVANITGSVSYEAQVVVGSGSATLSGVTSAEGAANANGSQIVLTFSFTVTATAAFTLRVQPSGGTVSVNGIGPLFANTHVLGWTAVGVPA